MAVLECGAVIDDADLPLVDGLSLWVVHRGTPQAYVEFKQKKKTHSLHRLLTAAGKGEFVDHINGDGLDNRRSNLRICTHTQNMQNRRIHRNNKSGFKGVYFDARRGVFRAEVSAYKKFYYVGQFKTAEAAHAAYLTKAKEVQGQFFSDGMRATPAELATQKEGA